MSTFKGGVVRRNISERERHELNRETEAWALPDEEPFDPLQSVDAAYPRPKETTVAATPNLPMNETKARELATPFQPVADRFAAAITDLQGRKLTRQTVEIAKEYDVEAIKYLNDLKGSELRKQADSAFNLHRFLTGIIAKLSAPADSLRRACSTAIINFDRQERQRAAEEQRQREEALRKQQEAEREAELAALEAAGAVEEAKALEAEPLPPVVSTASKEATKIDDVSVVYSAGWGEITDRVAFTRWLAEHPDEIAGFEPKMAYWKAKGSAHLNKQTGAMSLTIPGLKWAVSGSSRHRTNADAS